MIYDEPRYMAAGDQFLVMEIGTDMSLLSNIMCIEIKRILENESGVKGVLNTVSTWRSVMIQYNNSVITLEDLKKEMESIRVQVKDINEIPSRIVEIPIIYGGKWGPDFSATAEYNDVTEKKAIELHSGELQWVGLVGFVPGHPFVKPLRTDKKLAGKIYTSPRTYTPEGTVGLGGVTTTVYTVPVSGGYSMIGYIPAPLYDPLQSLPDFQKNAALLTPGDRIKFKSIDRDELDAVRQAVREKSYRFKIENAIFRLNDDKGGK